MGYLILFSTCSLIALSLSMPLLRLESALGPLQIRIFCGVPRWVCFWIEFCSTTFVCVLAVLLLCSAKRHLRPELLQVPFLAGQDVRCHFLDWWSVFSFCIFLKYSNRFGFYIIRFVYRANTEYFTIC